MHFIYILAVLLFFFCFSRSDQPPLTFQNDLPYFDVVQEAIELCNDIWYLESVQDGAKYLAELSEALSSHTFLKESSTDATAWVVTRNESGILYVIFKAFDYGDPREWQMVADANLDLLGANDKSYRVGATTSEMQSRNVKVQSGWNSAIFERPLNSTGTTMYQGILESMKNLLESSINTYTKIICTGSSQGGVMTTMFASYIAATDMASQNIQVITFGAPAVGNNAYRSFANSLENLAIWKVQNQDDPLPFFGIYVHPGHSIRISPLPNGTVDFQVYYLQEGNTTMGLAPVPDNFLNSKFYDPNVHLLDVGYLPYFQDSDSKFWPSPSNPFEELTQQQPKQNCSWWKFWC